MNLFGRRQADREKWGERLPPGQKATDGWPVLHYGSIPKIDLDTWTFEINGLVEEPLSLTWAEFNALPQVDYHNDIHCVTTWSKFDNDWVGVPVRELLSRVKIQPEATAVMVHSYGGYTTNLLLSDLDRADNFFALRHGGEALTREHGWPLRLVVPHLYFWKSAKWVHGLTILPQDKPGFWEMYGYHLRGDPWKEERYS
ncbi:MAG: sulfite oxidase-like oxidoreductase [Dehalococcoidia bacterium]